MKVKKKLFKLFFFLEFLLKVKCINWQMDGWAFGCDFTTRNLAIAKTTRSQCRPLCVRTKGCTHFTWSKSKGGSCWMKYGAVSKTFAFKTNDMTMVCGIISKKYRAGIRVPNEMSLGLQAHNKYRARHSANRLTLDSSISRSAKIYAQYLARTQQFKHSGIPGYGENLYKVCGNFNLKKVIQYATDAWYEEVSLYDFKNPGFSRETGHFTQIVWKSTKKIGFGVATDRKNCAYVVAHYSPQGNYLGEFRKNVSPY